jgi:hypothetical protein
MPNMLFILNLASESVKQNVVIIGTAGGATKMIKSKILITIIVGLMSVFRNYTSKITPATAPMLAKMRMNFPAVI